MHEVLVNRKGGLSLPRKSVVRLTDRPDMALDVYRERKTTIQQQQQPFLPLVSGSGDVIHRILMLFTLFDLHVVTSKTSLTTMFHYATI